MKAVREQSSDLGKIASNINLAKLQLRDVSVQTYILHMTLPAAHTITTLGGSIYNDTVEPRKRARKL